MTWWRPIKHNGELKTERIWKNVSNKMENLVYMEFRLEALK